MRLYVAHLVYTSTVFHEAMSSIFLSHSSKDNGIALDLKARLEQMGHQSVFLDFDSEDGIPVGREWEKELHAKLRECRAMIVLCSRASMASQWCFAEVTYAKLQGKLVLPVKIDNTDVYPILASLQIIDATVGWDAVCRRLEEGLKDLFDWDSTRSPYPGLPAFQEQDTAIFFGRDKEIRVGQELLNHLRQFGGARLTLMLGASGSGKSSLMRAGLLPRLKRDRRWVVIDPFRPLKTPFDKLARVLRERFSLTQQAGKGLVTDTAHARIQIHWNGQEAEQSVDRFLALIEELREKAGARETTVLLMIDQYEELLTLGAHEEGNRFLAFLRAVLDRRDSGLMVLATLRSDFLGSFQEHPAMRGLRVETVQVPQMAVDDFAPIIEGPAKLAHLELGPGLVQAMIRDTQTSDALPLLAFTLGQLWDGFGKDDKRLTLEQYHDKLGRLDGCIARAAEAVLTANVLSEKELSDLRDVFLSMVRVDDRGRYAKQPVLWNSLSASVHDVLEHFVAARLLVSGGDKKRQTLEVAHEALFRVWPRMVGWLDDDKSFMVWQQRLREHVSDWQRKNQDGGTLLRGALLGEAQHWFAEKADRLTDQEQNYIRHSAATHELAVQTEQERVERELAQANSLAEEAAKREEAERARAEAAEHARQAAEETRGVATRRAEEAERARRRQRQFSLVLLFLLLGGCIEAWLWQMGYNLEQAALKVKSVFVSIHVLPQMVPIKGGTFWMGDVERFNESWPKPAGPIKIKPFAMGKYEVTFEEYDRFTIATRRRMLDDHGWGRGQRPVISVSWDDATAYATWLSHETGTPYRLPTESEWEYAARSGAEQEAWAGTSDESQLAVYAIFEEHSENKPAVVGSKHPNQMGLYDMSGNVWEWVEDCWHKDYNGAPIDGSAWLDTNAGDCGWRVARGGSWTNFSDRLRTSKHGKFIHDIKVYNLGFRLAQDIP
jgi:formylglycine-generating enzyme required for sulfatase activity